MRIFACTALVVVVLSIAGCGRSTPLQPDRVNPAQSAQASSAQAFSQSWNATAAAASTGKPEIDPTYANGTTVYMIGPRLIVNARATMPNLYEHAEELYLVVYPQDSLPLPSGYQPQCNPCFHPGLPTQFVYHDHVISGAPGMGNNGTAGDYKAPWKIILLVYNPAYVATQNFSPPKSQAAIDAAEKAGNVFLPINTGGANPFEVDTGNVLICPTVSNHA